MSTNDPTQRMRAVCHTCSMVDEACMCPVYTIEKWNYYDRPERKFDLLTRCSHLAEAWTTASVLHDWEAIRVECLTQ